MLFSLNTPLLFMGDEHDESAPFRFFADHVDSSIADATRDVSANGSVLTLRRGSATPVTDFDAKTVELRR